MHLRCLLTATALNLGLTLTFGADSSQETYLHQFTKIQLSPHFWAEGAYGGDFNKDGIMDVVAGPFWYEGPSFDEVHEIYPATKSFKRKAPDGTEEAIPGFEGAMGVNNTYSDNFICYSYDFNRDGWDDILVIGFPGLETFWYENPRGDSGHWKRHVALAITDNESPTFGDLTGDGRPELICNSEGYIGYAQPDWTHPEKPWHFHRITPKGPWQRFTHGIGYGDVNGDGRMDILEKGGWWEQPESLEGDPVWTVHPFTFGTGGAQMYAYDVNGDGRNDVITSLTAHGYGIAWYENIKDGDGITFEEHIIINAEPSENPYGVKFSQPHAMELADINGDGLMDLVTGKRFWAHGPKGDAEPNAPAVLYWFELTRPEKGKAEYIPHLIDDDSGVGTQVAALDINGDNVPEILVGNKKGAFVFIHKKVAVDEQTWRKNLPKKIY